MSHLSEPALQRVWGECMRHWSEHKEPVTFVKSELRAAVDAVDTWTDTVQASYNQALPQPFRGAASPEQKAFLLYLVVYERFLYEQDIGG